MRGIVYRLEPTPIGSGGEGDVYCIHDMSAKVAKIYKPGVLTREFAEKLVIMLDNPPSETTLSQVAWPLDLVDNENGDYCGFVMPKLSINTELGEVYKYPSTLSIASQQKVNIAQNICVAISEVHKAGYVFGDFNPRNIGLDKNTGLVSFLDTDTYHVFDHVRNKTYRCNVCAPGYAAPELLEKCSEYVATDPAASKNAYAQSPLPTFTQETDNFALAIHIFKLLMNGYTPFGGIIESSSVSQSSPGVGDAAVKRDNYCFKPGYKHQSAAILPLETFPQEIADLFTRAFIIGRYDPKQRPSAVEWHEALIRFEHKMMACQHNPLHQYYLENTECPLCEADKRYSEAVSTPKPMANFTQKTYTPLKLPTVSPTPKSIPKPIASTTLKPMTNIAPKPIQKPISAVIPKPSPKPVSVPTPISVSAPMPVSTKPQAPPSHAISAPIGEAELIAKWDLLGETDQNSTQSWPEPIMAQAVTLEFNKGGTGTRRMGNSDIGGGYSTDFKWNLIYDKSFGNTLMIQSISASNDASPTQSYRIEEISGSKLVLKGISLKNLTFTKRK